MSLSQAIAFLEEVKDPAVRKVFVELFKFIEDQMVTKAEFRELKETVERLALKLEELTQRVNRLAEAQEKAEERLNRLEEAVSRLEKAVSRLEEMVEKLTKAQEKTEKSIRELVEARKQTEIQIQKIKENIGGLSHTVGYILEDRSYVRLPYLLKRDFGVEVEDLKRDHIEVAPNRYEEVNIIGHGIKDGKKVWIVGECKSQLKKKDVKNFERKLKTLDKILSGEKLIVFVTYSASPLVKSYLDKMGYKLYYSYELEKVRSQD